MKLILFLGAGVSIASGLPTADKLTKMVLRASHGGRATSGKPDSTLAVRTLLRCLNSFDARGCKNAIYRGAPTYEDLFSLCEAIKLWHVGLSDNSIPTPFVESIERLVRPILTGRSLKARTRHLGNLAWEASRLIEGVVVDALQASSVVGMKLILDLAKSPTIEQLNIVTLNHDTLVEQYLQKEGINFVDGFGHLDGDVRWHDDRLYDSESGKVRLFKLHGSVNWREFIGKTRTAIFTGSDIENIVDADQRTLKVSLRSPSFLSGVNKAISYQRGIYGDQHFRFHELLRTCNFILMSGYGWGDTSINWALDTWLDQDGRNSIILLHPRPDEIAERSVIVGTAYNSWIRNRRLVPVKKWLCQASMRDIEGLLRPAVA